MSRVGIHHRAKQSKVSHVQLKSRQLFEYG
jgi:hypothetical protein